MALNVLKNKLGEILNPIIPRYSYEVGDLFLTTNTENPNKRFGGTWELVAKGCTLVGVDTSQVEFNAVKKTGGEKEHKLTVEEMPSHKHNMNYGFDSDGGNGTGYHYSGTIGYNKFAMLNEGGDKPHNNMPPYFTCYIWMKTAN